ncbi:MAG TPA: hypothetical protein VGV37_24000 [Aliidongia sp.]|uniref:hypothetical protein n=1 Tax=Aliidongia sp. TaxID=1914230 RepID=UPI002DDC9ABC|nr:hypothetical protein [Aliidongia sp.]HEV2677615.1 hypothetical protein [Aliidongia sp.]
MQLGKRVIATGWFGNLDFMNRDNSMLIDYSLVPACDPQQTYDYRDMDRRIRRSNMRPGASPDSSAATSGPGSVAGASRGAGAGNMSGMMMVEWFCR